MAKKYSKEPLLYRLKRVCLHVRFVCFFSFSLVSLCDAHTNTHRTANKNGLSFTKTVKKSGLLKKKSLYCGCLLNLVDPPPLRNAFQAASPSPGPP